MAENTLSKLCGFGRSMPAFYDEYDIGEEDRVLKGWEFTSKHSPAGSDKSTMCPPLMKAVALFTGFDISRRWALGKTTDGSWVCELASGSRAEVLTIALWNPETGKMKAVSYDYTSGSTLKYSIDGAKGAPSRMHNTDATALCLCMMQEVAAEEEAASLLSDITKIFSGEMMSSEMKPAMAKLSDNFYRRCKSGDLKVDLGAKGTPTQMNMAEIKNSAVKIRETFYGTFEQVGVGDGTESVVIADGQYDFGIELTEEQKRFVPAPDDDYVVPPVEKKILDIMWRTKDNGKYAVKNFLLEGPPGSGKSEIVTDIARKTGLPKYLLGCSDGTNEDSMLGYYGPCVDEPAPFAGSLLELLKRIPTEAEIALAPDMAYEHFTGEASPAATPDDVKNAIYEAVKAAVAGGTGSVRYKYHEPGLVTGLKHGGIIEIAEPGAIVSPTVLTALNDVLNSVDGIVETPEGIVRRHPNCYIIATTNPDKYGGYRMLNEAVRDRFQRTYDVNTPTKDQMIDRVLAQGFLSDESLIEVLVRVISVLDATIEEKGIRGHVGMRSLFEWAKDIAAGDSVTESMMCCVINGITTKEEEQALLLEALRNNTEVYDLDRR